jgi:hypothetical protein
MRAIRRFFVSSLGHSGSGWLCKILNSHYEVLCFHSLEYVTYSRAWPPQHRSFYCFSEEEQFRNLMYVFSAAHRYGEIFTTLGAVCHSSRALLNVEHTAGTYFAHQDFEPVVFFLTRHPASYVQSQTDALVRMWKSMESRQSLEEWHRDAALERLAALPYNPDVAADLREKLSSGDFEGSAHLASCLAYVDFIATIKLRRAVVPRECWIKLEELTTAPGHLQQVLHAITGLEYDVSARMLEKVNVKSGARRPQDVFSGWSRSKRATFLRVLEPVQADLELNGYDLTSQPRVLARRCALL